MSGEGHNFHKHPDQEEVIYVIEGSIEQWLEDKRQELNAGDSVFIPADVVHASFNISSGAGQTVCDFGTVQRGRRIPVGRSR